MAGHEASKGRPAQRLEVHMLARHRCSSAACGRHVYFFFFFGYHKMKERFERFQHVPVMSEGRRRKRKKPTRKIKKSHSTFTNSYFSNYRPKDNKRNVRNATFLLVNYYTMYCRYVGKRRICVREKANGYASIQIGFLSILCIHCILSLSVFFLVGSHLKDQSQYSSSEIKISQPTCIKITDDSKASCSQKFE